MVTVDVVIPCYNYGRYLKNCVESVLSQSGVDVRVLVIDDTSTDDTTVVGSTLAASDPRVEFRRHDVNKGHIATYNEGLLEWSNGDYCVLLSADDLLVSGSLGRAVRIMEDDKRIGMVYGHAFEFTNNEELPPFSVHARGFRRWTGAEWLEGRFRAAHNVISSPEVVVRGSVQRAVGGYRPELPNAGDLEMWLRIATVSDIAYVLGVPQACYRIHSRSMLRFKFNYLNDLYERRSAFHAIIQDRAAFLAQPEYLRELAARGLAREALRSACAAYERDQVEERGADQLVEFAMATYPKAASLSEYAALRRRKWLGPRLCNRTQVFIGARIARFARSRLWRYRWKRRGT